MTDHVSNHVPPVRWPWAWFLSYVLRHNWWLHQLAGRRRLGREQNRTAERRGLAGPSRVSNSQQVHRAARNKHQWRLRNEGGTVEYFLCFPIRALCCQTTRIAILMAPHAHREIVRRSCVFLSRGNEPKGNRIATMPPRRATADAVATTTTTRSLYRVHGPVHTSDRLCNSPVRKAKQQKVEQCDASGVHDRKKRITQSKKLGRRKEEEEKKKKKKKAMGLRQAKRACGWKGPSFSGHGNFLPCYNHLQLHTKVGFFFFCSSA